MSKVRLEFFFFDKKKISVIFSEIQLIESSNLEVFESTGDLKYNSANFLLHGSKVGAILENHRFS